MTETRWKLKTIICKKCNEAFDVYLIKTRICFKCQKKINDKKYYNKHCERLKKYTKKWNKNNHRRKIKTNKEYYDKNKGIINYNKREKHKRAHKPKKLKPFHLWINNYDESMKTSARRLLQRAVGCKRIIKPSKCEECHRKLPSKLIHGHHTNYSKWWMVSWLCQTCHSELHIKKILKENNQ